MSTQSPRLQLIRNDGADPFKRSDFLANWDILDQFPGIYPCLSSSRPTWGDEKTGVLILETDTGRTLRWTGTAGGWKVLENYTRSYTGSINPGADVAQGSSTNFTAYSGLAIARACKLTVFMSAVFVQSTGQKQTASLTAYMDGSSIATGGATTMQFGDAGSGASGNASCSATSVGQASVSAGSHDIQAHIACGTLTTDSVHIQRINCLIVLSE